MLRNVPTSDFDSERIKRFLSSLTYLSSHHTFNQAGLCFEIRQGLWPEGQTNSMR